MCPTPVPAVRGSACPGNPGSRCVLRLIPVRPWCDGNGFRRCCCANRSSSSARSSTAIACARTRAQHAHGESARRTHRDRHCKAGTSPSCSSQQRHAQRGGLKTSRCNPSSSASAAPPAPDPTQSAISGRCHRETGTCRAARDPGLPGPLVPSRRCGLSFSSA
jgi:hypothetical protein